MDKSTIMLIIATVLAVIYLVAVLIEKRTVGKKQSLETAKEITLKLLQSVGLALVTEAERTYGSGTGVLKLSSVINEVLKLLPAWVTEIIDTEWLTEKIEEYLALAKIQWKSNNKLLGDTNKE